MKNLAHLYPDQKFGLSNLVIQTSLNFTDHEVVLLTVKIYNEHRELCFEDTKQSPQLQDCISEMIRSILEQYIWDNEK